MMKDKKYYLGLTVDQDCVGYAVTDKDYNVLKFNKKAMWGVRTFKKAETAETRRIKRSGRRILERRKNRIDLLQEMFLTEIEKVDKGFFIRMTDSALLPEDKREYNKYSLFNDKNYTDIDFHEQCPTMYHLRKDLMFSDSAKDIRLYYLAIQHILKNRGHFYMKGDFTDVVNFKSCYDSLKTVVRDELNIELSFKDTEDSFVQVLKDFSMKKKDKAVELFRLIDFTENTKENYKSVKAICTVLAGGTIKISDIFYESEIAKEDNSFSFTKGDYDVERERIIELIGQQVCVFDALKAVYDFACLSDILEGGEVEDKSYLSVAKVNQYEIHKRDLESLKYIIRKYDIEKYNSFFKQEEKDNYCAYIGSYNKNGKSVSIKKCGRKEFLDRVKKIISVFEVYDEDKDLQSDILDRIEFDSFMPKQRGSENSIIPYQVHKIELVQILKNLVRDFPVYSKKDSDGLSVADKIMIMFEFYLPYYIGPLTGKFSWCVRKETGKIYPWNFKQKIDVDETAKNFILRLTNNCTYIPSEDVLPKNSILYSKYMVLNELNAVKVLGQRLDVEIKQKVFDELFCSLKKVTAAKLSAFLRKNGIQCATTDLSGIDKEFKVSMSSYIDFKKIFGDYIDTPEGLAVAENVIRYLTIYAQDTEIIKNVIRKEYDETIISDAQLEQIAKKSFSGWGSFSERFLTVGGRHRESNKPYTIIQALYETQDNLNQLLSSNYTFMDTINEINKVSDDENVAVTYENIVEPLCCSPAIKRAVWQAIKISEEIKKIMGKPAEKIFIEMARGTESYTTHRKRDLIAAYKKIKSDDAKKMLEELEQYTESDLKNIKLYLYFTQMGRCMYSGERIDRTALSDSELYNKEHIYPRSMTKDDSLGNNVVLVKKELNKGKDNEYPLSKDIQDKMVSFWKILKDASLITSEKFSRLVRTTPLSVEELSEYISRATTERRQSSKFLADVMQKIYPKSTTVYVKGGLVSDFRQDELQIYRSYSVNDFWHAKDAYLNIVVGNVHYEKFTNNPLIWLQQNKGVKYNLYKLYDKNIVTRNGDVIWAAGPTGTYSTVMKHMRRNDILYTRLAGFRKTGQNGGFFDENIVSKDKNAKVPIKKGIDTSKYGGYKTITSSHYSLIESESKKGKQLSIQAVPLYLKEAFTKDESKFIEYLSTECELVNPKIFLPIIKDETIISINGFNYILKGASGVLTLTMAMQLMLSLQDEQYMRRIYNYIRYNDTRTDKKNNLPVPERSGISVGRNLELYDVLTEKLRSGIYNMSLLPAKYADMFTAKREMFEHLVIEEQCILLNEIIKLFQCNAAASNLTMLGGSANSGKMKGNKVLDGYDSVCLIEQSVTGLFEKKRVIKH